MYSLLYKCKVFFTYCQIFLTFFYGNIFSNGFNNMNAEKWDFYQKKRGIFIMDKRFFARRKMGFFSEEKV